MNQLAHTYPFELIAKAKDLTEKGHYLESLKVLKEIKEEGSLRLTAVLAAKTSILFARNYLHLHEDAEALTHLHSIPRTIFESFPEIASECCMIKGNLKRREADSVRRSGNVVEAEMLAQEARELFSHAESYALWDGNGRLASNARLNAAYCEGLILAIRKAPKHEYEPLVKIATEAEASSRTFYDDSQPKNTITGLLIAIDLALGAGLGLSQIGDLYDDPSYLHAYKVVFSPPNSKARSWDELILEQVQDNSRVDANILGKMLILGAKLVLESRNYDNFAFKYFKFIDNFLKGDLSLTIRGKLLIEVARFRSRKEGFTSEDVTFVCDECCSNVILPRRSDPVIIYGFCPECGGKSFKVYDEDWI